MSAGHPESLPKMSFRSPRGGSTPNWPGHDGEEYDYARMPSATPTPPRANATWYESTPKRPSTRAGHSRHFSSSSVYSPKPPANSPRYNSSGLYSTDRADIGSESPAYVTSPTAYDTMRAQAASQQRPPTSFAGHRRSSSSAVPPRSSTVKPTSQQRVPKPSTFKQPPPTASKGRATPEDAKLHGIPTGYSLKNWDPKLEPILVYGSVFDCNSLGKWIFDWVVHLHGNDSPFGHIAGDLWILMIKLYGKSHKMENALEWNRSSGEDRKILDEFDAASDRLKGRLRDLIKHCEAPAGDKSRQGSNAGIAFVEALLDKDHSLDEAEKWMHHTRVWVQRFDVNCEPIIRNVPGA